MRWPEDADGWPLAEASRIVLCKPHRWHVQEAGEGPLLLLIHGAGGATQSWRNLFPILARSNRVIAVDLPGQGFTQSGAQRRFGLNAMAEDLSKLCKAESWEPDAIIGHSAGAAIALRMVQTGFSSSRVIGINAALGEFKGVAGWLFPAMAKLLATTPLAASVFAASTRPSSIRRLLQSTGSNIGEKGQELYLRLAQDRAHVDATLSMMAQWELGPLIASLENIKCVVHLIVGSNDLTVPPTVSETAASRLPNATFEKLDSLGHLAHEEDAQRIAASIQSALDMKTPGTSPGAPSNS